MVKLLLGLFLVCVLLVIVTGMAGCSTYNGIVASSQSCDTQWAQVQNVYQRRLDLIPNLVSTVQGAANFEKSTLTDVIKARASATAVTVNAATAPTDPEQLKQFQAAQNALGQSLSRLLVSVERYPDLKSNSNFLTLQSQLEGTENRIATERERFNQVVQAYDTKIKQVPTVFVAHLGGFTAKPYFAAVADAQTAPKVNFDFNAPAPAPATAKP